MERILVGSIVTVVGFLLIIFRDKFVGEVIKLNNNTVLGFYKYGKSEERFGLWFTIFFGIIALFLGCLILLGIFKLK